MAVTSSGPPEPPKKAEASEPPPERPGSCGLAGCKLTHHHHHTALDRAKCKKC
jgi:hypothetical protein